MQRRNLQRRDLPVHFCAAYVKEHHAFELKDMDSLKDNEVYISDTFDFEDGRFSGFLSAM